MKVSGKFTELAARFIAMTRRWPRAIFALGCALSLAIALVTSAPFIGDGQKLIRDEMHIHADVENLYEAAAASSWTDAPHWWVGSWIYPHVGYYRPLTSMLFLAEQKCFGLNFDSFNRVTWMMHGLNATLLFALAYLMLGGHPLLRLCAGLTAVRYFATQDSSFYFAPQCALRWWPAQNDPLCLIFGLTSLILLQLYLDRGRKAFLYLSLLGFFLAIAAKELGHITMPIAIAMIAYRKRKFVPEMLWFALLGIGMFLFRKLVVPHTWDPRLFTRVVLVRALHQWLGPFYGQLGSQTYWPTGAAVLSVIACGIGLKRRWPLWVIGVLVLVAICLSGQFLEQNGSWALFFVGEGFRQTTADFVFLSACALFWRYRRTEPGLPVAAAFVLSFIPVLNYAGLHYFYWPSAFLALADAVFVRCLARAAHELWLDRRAPSGLKPDEAAAPVPRAISAEQPAT